MSFARVAVFALLLASVAQAQYIPDIGDINTSGMGSSFGGLALRNWAKVNSRVAYEDQSSAIGLDALLIHRNITYAGTELMLSAQERADHPTVVTFPVLAGAIVPRVNLGRGAELDLEPLVLTRDILVRIFMRQIRSWLHPDILALNPKRVFPPSNITAATRLGRCGTNRAVSTAFSIFSDDWAQTYGIVEEWPADLRRGSLPAATNEKLVGTTRVVRFSVGMAAYSWVANQFDVKFFARLINRSGNQVSVNPTSINAAVANVVYDPVLQEIPIETTYDSDNASAWPMVAITNVAIDTRGTPRELCDDFVHAIRMLGDAMRLDLYSAVANNEVTLNEATKRDVLDILGGVTCAGRRIFDPDSFSTAPSLESRSLSLSPFSISGMRIPSSFKPPYYDTLGRTISPSDAPSFDLSTINLDDSDSSSSSASYLSASLAALATAGLLIL